MIENVLKNTFTSLAQCIRNMIQAYCMHNLSCVYATSPFQHNWMGKIETLTDPRCLSLLLDYSYQSGLGISVSLKGC